MTEGEDVIGIGWEATLYAADERNVFLLTCTIDKGEVTLGGLYHGLGIGIIRRFGHIIDSDFGARHINRFQNGEAAVMGELGEHDIGEEMVEIG